MNLRLLFIVLFVITFCVVGCEKADNESPGIPDKPDKKKIEQTFMQFREDFKKAWQKGDIETVLKYYPADEKVIHIRDGKISWLNRREKTEEYQRKKYTRITDIEGPFIRVTECGCCVWISGKTRYETEEGEEEDESWIDTYESTDGGWQQTASSNSVESPRFP